MGGVVNVLSQDMGARPLYSAPMVPLLPGADLVEQGIADLAHGVESVPALLVSIGGPRLRRLGYDVPPAPPGAEHRLYELLERQDPDAAHSRYNALIRRLVRFA